jgi:hypothetical protein
MGVQIRIRTLWKVMPWDILVCIAVYLPTCDSKHPLFHYCFPINEKNKAAPRRVLQQFMHLPRHPMPAQPQSQARRVLQQFMHLPRHPMPARPQSQASLGVRMRIRMRIRTLHEEQLARMEVERIISQRLRVERLLPGIRDRHAAFLVRCRIIGAHWQVMPMDILVHIAGYMPMCMWNHPLFHFNSCPHTPPPGARIFPCQWPLYQVSHRFSVAVYSAMGPHYRRAHNNSLVRIGSSTRHLGPPSGPC